MIKEKNLQPLNGRILIEVVTEEEKYEGMIELTMGAKEKSNIALVKTLPIGYTSESVPLKEGDKVIFNLNSGSILVLDKFNKDVPEFRLIKEDDILCKINAD